LAKSQQPPIVRSAQFISRIVFAAIELYALILLFLFITRWLVGERLWFIGLFNSLMPVVLLPVIVLFIMALITRRIRTITLYLPIIASMAMLYGGMLVPKGTRTPHSNEITLRVATFNTLSTYETFEGKGNVIRDINADVIALQEVNDAFVEYLAVEFAEMYPYQSNADGQYLVGQTVLSKYPIGDRNVWSVDGRPAYQQVTINVAGKRVNIYNLHPPPPDIPRGNLRFSAVAHRRGIDSILARLDQDATPAVLLGDFNMSDASEGYDLMAARFTDVYRTGGFGFGSTFPNLSNWSRTQLPAALLNLPPMLRIDYIFHNNISLRTLNAERWQDSASSDHYPVVATLALQQTP
jgi:endonuclease/exonuclease/phosphatase family metal-dependent hydrolase